MSFVGRSIILCPYLGGSTIGGSTLYRICPNYWTEKTTLIFAYNMYLYGSIWAKQPVSLKIGCLRNSNEYGSNRKVQVHAYNDNVSVSLAFPLIVIKSPKAFHVKPAHKHNNIMSVNQFALVIKYFRMLDNFMSRICFLSG